MKQIFFALLITLFAHEVKAQPPATLHVDATQITCTDLEMVVSVWDLTNPCVIVGVSNPIPVSGNSTYDYNAISTGVGWNVDPGPWVIGTNDWHFAIAEVYNCNAPSIGSPTCSFYDGATVGNHACLSYSSSNCFEYSTSCSSCGMGQIINLQFSAGGISTLQIY